MATQLGAYNGTDMGETQLFVVGANLSGELFKVAADRPAALAVGFEHRNEFGAFTNNPILAAGWDSDTGSPGPSDTRGGFYVNEGYGELVVPVVNHIPFAEELEVQAAARGFKYNTFGSDWTYKLGARWSPIRDVTFRGTYSTAFRAPNILELFRGRPAATSSRRTTRAPTPTAIRPWGTLRRRTWVGRRSERGEQRCHRRPDQLGGRR